MINQVLYYNRWISLHNIVDEKSGAAGYVYSHETRCNGRVIAVLPYRQVPIYYTEYGLRREVTPCWGMKAQLSALTGGCEKEGPMHTAIMEIKEEVGFVVTEEMVETLGVCRGTKSTDTTYHLYAVDVTGLDEGEATGDGSRLDSEGTIEWHRTIAETVDPIVAMMYYRLEEKRSK